MSQLWFQSIRSTQILWDLLGQARHVNTRGISQLGTALIFTDLRASRRAFLNSHCLRLVDSFKAAAKREDIIFSLAEAWIFVPRDTAIADASLACTLFSYHRHVGKVRPLRASAPLRVSSYAARTPRTNLLLLSSPPTAPTPPDPVIPVTVTLSPAASLNHRSNSKSARVG